jgi:tetratricopeptide (TPR) repeat protein
MSVIPPNEPDRMPGPSRSPAPDPPGPAIPGYEVDGEIARGGMGAILAARDLALDREVAIKVLLPEVAADAARRFVTESKITARLSHPGIPSVHALGELPDGSPFLAMRLIRGRTLADLLAERPDPSADLPRFVAVFEQVCQAVASAHAQRIIHRDLKPGNVMVGAFGEVQVMDWGLAKALADGRAEPGRSPGVEVSELTPAGAVLGTPAYMAPEQARGQPDLDERTDVFALGGILCTILTGRPPFEGADARMTLGMAATENVSPALGRLASCGADAKLVGIATRCLSPDPLGRPPDAGALAADVAAYRSGVEERLRRAEAERDAVEAEAAEAAGQLKRQRVQLMLVTAVVGLLLLGGVAALRWQDRRGEQRRTREARLAGERDAETRLKAEQARDGVRAALGRAAALRGQYRFREAEAALKQAADLAAGGAPELAAEVEQAGDGLAFARELDGIRYRKWAWVAEVGGKGRFDVETAPPAYRAAFLARGFDLAGGEASALSAQVAASAIKPELIAALDDWAAHEPDPALRNRLLGVARGADPGPWTDRLRDPAVRSDRAKLEQLAREADPAVVPPANLAALAELLRPLGIDPTPLLTAAQRRDPSDFELNFHLGRRFHDTDPAAAVGYYRAARAVRPDNTVVLNNLGTALSAVGRFPEAVACLEEAIRLDPGCPHAHGVLGTALWAAGDIPAARAALTEAARLDAKKWEPVLKQLPPPPPAAPPREAKMGDPQR